MFTITAFHCVRVVVIPLQSSFAAAAGRWPLSTLSLQVPQRPFCAAPKEAQGLATTRNTVHGQGATGAKSLPEIGVMKSTNLPGLT
ncbi:hypothetical protein CKAH01_00255 [Colletotrichum kahawae]|uniref:Secreted protein n=1 Tax=Colletotrichum kahawae TaxID=34407 RepID=A0AAE0DEQ5_COLKA|nr:hypothetical protein CKAH01_00255 [Colletotrichum kahawae]